MVKRLAYILRGPASILLLIGILAAGGAAINYFRTAQHSRAVSAQTRPTTQSRPTATSSPAPQPSPTLAPRPVATRRPAPTARPLSRTSPKPRPTAKPAARLRLFVSHSAAFGHSDPATGMQISLPHAVMVAPGRGGSRPAPGRVWLLLEVSLTNRKQPFAAFGEADFFAVASNGQTFPAKVRDPSHRALGSGRLKIGASVSGWVGFALPTLPTSGSVIWNDNNHLIPPAELLKYTIRAA